MFRRITGFASLFHGLRVGLKLEQVQSSLRPDLSLKCLPQHWSLPVALSGVQGAVESFQLQDPISELLYLLLRGQEIISN